jgi:hypothetical protein
MKSGSQSPKTHGADLLSKREAIAAQVLAGICANPAIGEIWGNNRDDWAKRAVEVADALLLRLHG